MPHGAAEAAEVGLGHRHEVRAAQPVQLDAVLEAAQVPVGAVEDGGVVAPDVAAAGERGQGLERRRRRAATGVAAPVHELEQLHAELDVAQAARARA